MALNLGTYDALGLITLLGEGSQRASKDSRRVTRRKN